MQPYGYNPPPPPQPSSNVGLIIGCVAAVFVVLMLGVIVVGAAVFSVRAKRSAPAPIAVTAPTAVGTAGTVPSGFTETYTSKNGLVTIHYPPDYTAKNMDEATLVLTRYHTDGTSELVEAAAVPDPLSDDVNEFARHSLGLMVKNIEAAGDSYVETGRRKTACFQSNMGLEVKGTLIRKTGGTDNHIKTCYFMDSTKTKGYVLRTSVPITHEGTYLPVLQSIIDATELR